MFGLNKKYEEKIIANIYLIMQQFLNRYTLN